MFTGFGLHQGLIHKARIPAWPGIQSAPARQSWRCLANMPAVRTWLNMASGMGLLHVGPQL